MKGHELIYEIGDYDYSWAVFGVFRRDDGAYFYATDAGCSCYSPWEDDDLATYDPMPITNETFESFSRELLSWAESPQHDDDRRDSAPNSTLRERAWQVRGEIAKALR